MGGGNIVSTAADISKFGMALSAPGLLSKKELEILYSEDWFGSYDEDERLMIYATGANPGVQAGLAIYPQYKISAVVLSNTWGIGSRSAEMVELAKKLAQKCINK